METTICHSIGYGTVDLEINWEICDMQGQIYEHVCELGYDMAIFSDLYLRSNFCE